MLRRIVARTVVQQIRTVVERATAPFQYVMSTRAGTECVAHALQALSELDPRATIVSIDGVSAFDLISRRAMMEALMELEVGSQILPFVRMFMRLALCKQSRTNFWRVGGDDIHVVTATCGRCFMHICSGTLPSRSTMAKLECGSNRRTGRHL